MMELKLNNIIQNMDEFIKRIGVKNMPKDLINAISSMQVSKNLNFYFADKLLENFPNLKQYFDYSDNELIQITKLISEHQQMVANELIEKHWVNQTWRGVSAVKVVPDKNLGFSLEELKRYKTEFQKILLKRKFLYHGTSVSNYDSIKKHGLISQYNFFDETQEPFGVEETDKTYLTVGIETSKFINNIYPDPENFVKSIDKYEVKGNIIFWKLAGINLDVLYAIFMTKEFKNDYLGWLVIDGKISPNNIVSMEILENELFDDFN